MAHGSRSNTPLLHRLIGWIMVAGTALLLANALAFAEPVIGQPAPALAGTTMTGAPFDLTRWRGKIVLVNYWATWCGPCRREMPLLETFHQRHQDHGFELVSISIDRPQDHEKVRRAVGTLSYPIVLARDLSSDGFGIPQGVPISYVIDADGIVRDTFIEVRAKLLQDVVVPLLTK